MKNISITFVNEFGSDTHLGLSKGATDWNGVSIPLLNVSVSATRFRGTMSEGLTIGEAKRLYDALGEFLK